MSETVTIHIGTGDKRKSYFFDYGKVRMQEAMLVEQKTGLGMLDLVFGLPRLSPTSLVSVVWLLRRRDEPGLRFEDVDFTMDDVEVEEHDGPKDDASDTGEPSSETATG